MKKTYNEERTCSEKKSNIIIINLFSILVNQKKTPESSDNPKGNEKNPNPPKILFIVIATIIFGMVLLVVGITIMNNTDPTLINPVITILKEYLETMQDIVSKVSIFLFL